MHKTFPLRASAIPPQGFCRNGRFVLDTPLAQWRRCLHPHARYRRETAVEALPEWQRPERRNAHNGCPDFRPWRRWERLLRVAPAFVLVGALLLVALLWVWLVYQWRLTYEQIHSF